MRYIKRLAAAVLSAACVASLCACGTNDALEPAETGTPAESASVQESELDTASAASEPEIVSGTGAYTAYVDYEPQQARKIDMVQGTDSNVLVAYFSHATNTVLPDGGLDAVTSASIRVQDDAAAIGNTQQIAEWIAEETGGDLFAIQTEYTYPHDYDDLVSVGEGQDIDGVIPSLLDMPDDVEQYSYVYLVYPIWHFTLPAPVRAFLINADLNGKTIFAFASNSGSSFGSSIEVIEQYEPDARVIEGVSIRQSDVAEARDEVLQIVQELMEEAGETVPGQSEQPDTSGVETNSMRITIGDNEFTASLYDTDAAQELKGMMESGPVTIELSDYSGFEKVGPLGRSLTTSNEQITTEPGDIMLYNGDNIVFFYGTNTWSYTPLAKVDDLTGWAEALGDGNVTVVLSLA